MGALKSRRSVVVAVVVGAMLVGVGGGLYAGRRVSRSRPTCANAISNYFAVMPKEQRAMFEGFGQFGRDANVRTCREGRWSDAMKTCWLHATSTSDIDACPNEWLNARTICEQVEREAKARSNKCNLAALGLPDCRNVHAIGINAVECIEELRDADCRTFDRVPDSCKGMLLP